MWLAQNVMYESVSVKEYINDIFAVGSGDSLLV